MSYPNLKLMAALSMPWICGLAACRFVAPYTPGGMLPLVCVGTAGGLTGIAGLIMARFQRPNLGGDSANPQPHLTAGANAHDALHPLESAPLPQRRPWALPSLRSIAVFHFAVACALAVQWIWLRSVPLIPVNRMIWHIVCAIIYASTFSAFAIIGGAFVLCLDIRAERRGGPEADSEIAKLRNL